MSAECGCGCGGGSTTATGGCGCGGHDAALTRTGFVRPRFFAGMLLTEDDLQATVDYASTKRRLTNRYVIGAGVVCGLDVTPDRCDPAVVVVSPGYAIECCGNDILVSCAEEVNVLDLVRDLRLRTGVDCGEPCDEQPHQEYHLYLRYAETPSAPVAPYAPDDCATGECEFSRVDEGYRFELRCDGPEDTPSLIKALRACRPKDEDAKRDTGQIIGAMQLAEHRSVVSAELATGVEPLVKAPAAPEFRKILVDPAKPEAGVDFDAGVQLVNRVLVAQAQHAATGPLAGQPVSRAVSPAVIARTQKLAEELRGAEALTTRAPEEQDRIRRLLTTAVEQPDLSGLSAVDRGWLRAGTFPGTADRTFVAQAESVRGSVLRQLSDRGQTGSEDFRVVSAMRFDGLTDASERDVTRLGRAFVRLANGCTCSAFNPPCPTCTDDAVALAKVRVEDCKVVDVCALDRRWVLSPRALGYWFPVVETVRELLERFCCGRPDPQHPEDEKDPAAQTPEGVARATGMRLQQDLRLAGGDRGTQESVVQLQRQLEAVTQRLDAMTAEKGVPS